MNPNTLRSSTRSTAPGTASALPKAVTTGPASRADVRRLARVASITAIIVPPVVSAVVLVWMDLEMTGLDHGSDVIVEIATSSPTTS